jgi:predicted ATPase
VVTGGPGAGKTALLELLRKNLCEHAVVLPEAASILWGGGFPRGASIGARKAAQRAIFHIQHEVEDLVWSDDGYAVVLCDRGTIDGAAYWPGSVDEMWAELGTRREKEYSRYAAVIHLETPTTLDGYNHANPLRIETAQEAAAIDARLLEAWSWHPRVLRVAHTARFLDKVAEAERLIRAELPSCCRSQ